MNPSFYSALGFTLNVEGYYSNDPVDRGGATKWGIVQRTYDGWRHGKKLAMQPVLLMTRPEMEEIYYSDFWVPAHCDEMPMRLATTHFDAFVNHRPSVAFRLLQLACDAAVDGRYGPNTKAAVAQAVGKFGEREVISRYLAARKAFYTSLVVDDATQDKFLNGWNNRLKKLAITVGMRDTAVA